MRRLYTLRNSETGKDYICIDTGVTSSPQCTETKPINGSSESICPPVNTVINRQLDIDPSSDSLIIRETRAALNCSTTTLTKSVSNFGLYEIFTFEDESIITINGDTSNLYRDSDGASAIAFFTSLSSSVDYPYSPSTSISVTTYNKVLPVSFNLGSYGQVKFFDVDDVLVEVTSFSRNNLSPGQQDEAGLFEVHLESMLHNTATNSHKVHHISKYQHEKTFNRYRNYALSNLSGMGFNWVYNRGIVPHHHIREVPGLRDGLSMNFYSANNVLLQNNKYQNLYLDNGGTFYYTAQSSLPLPTIGPNNYTRRFKGYVLLDYVGSSSTVQIDIKVRYIWKAYVSRY